MPHIFAQQVFEYYNISHHKMDMMVKIGKEIIIISLMKGVGAWGSSVTDAYSLVVVSDAFKFHLVTF